MEAWRGPRSSDGSLAPGRPPPDPSAESPCSAQQPPLPLPPLRQGPGGGARDRPARDPAAGYGAGGDLPIQESRAGEKQEV